MDTLPPCSYTDEGECDQPVTRRIVQRDNMGEAFCCETHFINYAIPGNSVYGLNGEHAPASPPAV